MKSNLTISYNPSFGKVIPVKKIIFDSGDAPTYEQMSIDTFEPKNSGKAGDSSDLDLSKKAIQALNRILLKNDGAENNKYKNTINNMVRRSFAQVVKDYKIPLAAVDSSHNEIIKPCYNGPKNFLLTGKEASEYANSGRNIGGTRALVRDHYQPAYTIDKSKRSFANCKTDILADSQARLKNQYGKSIGLVIYADTVSIPKKGHKGFKTEIDIKGIDFEPV